MLRLVLIALLVPTVGSPGCLQPQTGAVGTTAQPDASADSVADETAEPDSGCPRAPAEVPSCTPGGCDDGDPCTDDLCDCGADACGDPVCYGCTHTAIAGCGEPTPVCDDTGITTLHALASQGNANEFVKVRATAALYGSQASCDDGPCSRCYGPPAAGDASGADMLLWGPLGQPDWTCEESPFCSPTAACDPVHVGPEYLFWGVANPIGFVSPSDDDGFAPPPAPPSDDDVDQPLPPLVDMALTVQGWCLRTYGGHYRGTLEDVEGAVVDVAMDVTLQGDRYSVRLYRACPGCESAVENVLTTSTVDDTGLWFELPGTVDPFVGGAFPDVEAVDVTLSAHQNTLSGVADFGTGTTRALTLTRVQNPLFP